MLVRCPVGKRCVLDVGYSWHVPLIAPLHVLAVEADEWFHQVFHKVSGSLELGRQFLCRFLGRTSC